MNEAEVIHEHVIREDNAGTNLVIGLIILVVLVLLIVYGLPALRSSVQVPSIQVPGKIDVNINQPKNP